MLMNLLAPLAGGLSQLAAAASEEEELFGEEAEGLFSSLASTPFWPAWSSVWEMVMRLLINVITIGIIVHAFYYPKAKRRDYYFTFSIIGVSIFIKYRTEQVPIREMTYMFVIIAVAAINGLATSVSYFELLGTNLIFIIALAICENTKWMKHVPSKLIKYDNVKLIAHGKEDELKADLEKRLGLKIIRIEVGNVDFLKDSAIIKIYYEPIMDEFGTIDSVMKTGKIK